MTTQEERALNRSDIAAPKILGKEDCLLVVQSKEKQAVQIRLPGELVQSTTPEDIRSRLPDQTSSDLRLVRKGIEDSNVTFYLVTVTPPMRGFWGE